MIVNIENLPAGSMLRVKPDHFAILGWATPDGYLTVIDARDGGVQVRTLQECVSGRPIELVWAPQTLDQQNAALDRAYSKVGHPYNLLFANCEHFANWVVTGRDESPQVTQFTVGGALLGLGVWALLRAD